MDVASLLLVCASAQNLLGISKQTYAGTDPLGYLNWLYTYLPVHCPSDQKAPQCFGREESCGQKARISLCDEGEQNWCDGTIRDTFGLHMENLWARPSGPTSVAEVEAVFQDKMAAAFRDGRYDSFMDFALVFWASDLDVYIDKFEEDHVKYLCLSWETDSGNSTFSLIVHVPHTQVVFELVSTSRPKKASSFLDDVTVRYTDKVFQDMNASTDISSKVLLPLAISKAISNMSNMLDFYSRFLNATTMHRKMYRAGSEIAILDVLPKWKSGLWTNSTMSIRFVSRPASWTSSSMSVKQLEMAKFAGHDWVHDNKGNLSANCICGFDKWYDNHYAYQTSNLNWYKTQFDSNGWPYYHVWGLHGNMFVVDPTGDAIQLNGRWSTLPAGASGDSLTPMCGQGSCTDALPPTPQNCASALRMMCPGLEEKNASCTDCVYEVSTHQKLGIAGCFNSDMVAFCVSTSSNTPSTRSTGSLNSVLL
jgi:hypothetical protein